MWIRVRILWVLKCEHLFSDKLTSAKIHRLVSTSKCDRLSRQVTIELLELGFMFLIWTRILVGENLNNVWIAATKPQTFGLIFIYLSRALSKKKKFRVDTVVSHQNQILRARSSKRNLVLGVLWRRRLIQFLFNISKLCVTLRLDDDVLM